MDVLTTLRVCVRRWYVALPILIIGILGAVGYAASQKPTWSVTQQLLVTAPSSTNGIKPGSTSAVNPFGSGPNAQHLAASGMASALQSQTTKDQIRSIGRGANYTAKVDKVAPTVDVTVTGPTRHAVAARLQALTYAAQVDLFNIQQRAGAPVKQFLQVVPSIQGAPTPAEVPPSRTKGTVAILLLTLLVAAFASIAAERIATRRRRGEVSTTPLFEPTVADADVSHRVLDLDAPGERASLSG
jgi:hypothetical protein